MSIPYVRVFRYLNVHKQKNAYFKSKNLYKKKQPIESPLNSVIFPANVKVTSPMNIFSKLRHPLPPPSKSIP